VREAAVDESSARIGTGLERVTVAREGTPVLRDVTLLADDGDLVVVLGSSGSGKTTLLRALGGLEKVRSGTVVIRGRDVTELPPGARRVAMVFEKSALVSIFDVARNMGWGLQVQGLPGAEVAERVDDRARRLRLSRLLPRRPDSLSTGERGLVGLGHALVQRPDAFLLDEPLTGLDTAERTRVRRELVDLVRSLGVTTFVVTHDEGDWLAVADRVALLDDGVLVQSGRPKDLYERPVNLFVAGSVGVPPIGLLSARLVAAGGQAAFTVGERTLPLWGPVPPPLRDHVGRDVVLGLRAEDVHDATTGPDADAVVLDAVAEEVEYTGRHDLVTLAVGAPPVTAPGIESSVDRLRGATLRSCYPPRAGIRRGSVVQVAVTAADAHVFDADTGRALWHPGRGSGESAPPGPS
jgi:multiple sugar transport system ATP-binding protein